MSKHVLQLCHSYRTPFSDCARQYAALFRGTDYAVTTVYLTGPADDVVRRGSASKEVIFLEYTSRDIRGLKRRQIEDIRRLHRERQFDFAIAHRFKSLYICGHVPGLFTLGVHHAFGGYRRWSRRWFAYRHREYLALLGVSDAVRNDIRGCLPRLPAGRVQTLYNRIDLATMREGMVGRGEARAYLGLDPEHYIFANVGRLHPDKDQSTLIRGFSVVSEQLPDARLVIVGGGRDEQKLRQLVESLYLTGRVLFLGIVPEAWRYFRAFDSFVLSSDHEPFGMVLLEAMAAGIPVASTDCGGAREVISDCGYLFPLGDVDALARVMMKLHDLSTGAVTDFRQRMDRQVLTCFSYEAAQDRFWLLPFLHDYRG
ncbi:MAG: Glycosyltransferase involved in cell wall bisynthesis [Candidatus Kentron sp. G]|nr:MAG: Glycosyltransferase involved in cell wall bisynthesis [Candidatus Kentron sp. G]VFN01555.1 MAG: Glycosyltransferase involved in cell wall bisynthesis [Candidatus Kentron sp. G]